MSTESDSHTIVIDNGSGVIKAGFNVNNEPSIWFPSHVGITRICGGGMVGMKVKNTFVGEETENREGLLLIKYPIKHGIVNDWNDMVWKYFNVQKYYLIQN